MSRAHQKFSRACTKLDLPAESSTVLNVLLALISCAQLSRPFTFGCRCCSCRPFQVLSWKTVEPIICLLAIIFRNDHSVCNKSECVRAARSREISSGVKIEWWRDRVRSECIAKVEITGQIQYRPITIRPAARPFNRHQFAFFSPFTVFWIISLLWLIHGSVAKQSASPKIMPKLENWSTSINFSRTLGMTEESERVVRTRHNWRERLRN